MELHAYDLFMVVVILVATLFGAWKGMAWQLASISSLIVSYFIALRWAETLAPYVHAEAPWNKFAAMLIVYLASSAAIWLIFQAVSSFIERVKLQEFDQQVGALFGACKGVVICVAITFFAVTISQTARNTILATHSGHYVAVVLDKMQSVLPTEYNDVIQGHWQMYTKAEEPAPSNLIGEPKTPAVEGLVEEFADRLEVDERLRRQAFWPQGETNSNQPTTGRE